jgi:hypothetical protein
VRLRVVKESALISELASARSGTVGACPSTTTGTPVAICRGRRGNSAQLQTSRRAPPSSRPSRLAWTETPSIAARPALPGPSSHGQESRSKAAQGGRSRSPLRLSSRSLWSSRSSSRSARARSQALMRLVRGLVRHPVDLCLPVVTRREVADRKLTEAEPGKAGQFSRHARPSSRARSSLDTFPEHKTPKSALASTAT